nr:ribonuclease H-like domain-containing protein [Tanacetum cinerariifolium]
MVTRSRVGTTPPNPRYAGHVSTIFPLPRSYKEAFNDPNWRNAMFDEYNALIKNKTLTSVPRPEGANIVRCMWLSRHKFLADGTLSRYKARLVANGSTQVEGVDVDETFSPVVKPAETVYMHQPPGFRDPEHPNYVCLLQRSLYGLKQASRAWFQRFAAYITTVGLLLVIVTPIYLFTNRIITSLHREFSMTDLGALNYFLGFSVTRDSSSMFLSKRKYAMEILERAHMVCLYMHDPREPHFSALKRILRYVQGTLDYGLQLFSSTTDSLIAYSDADWAGCPTTRRSTSGYCVFLGNNLLSWSSKLQPMLSRSSAEAEYRGVANAVAETCWIRNLLRELHTPLYSVTIVYCDNPDVEPSVWRDQKGRYVLAKRYPLTHFTLEQMLNNVRLEVEEESEISLELLRGELLEIMDFNILLLLFILSDAA